MATNTTNYNFKKPDESDFYSVQDQNNNWDKADAALKDLDTPTFEDYSGSTTVPDAAIAIGNIKSKGKLSTTISNIKAAFKGVCLIGQIVNNCVTNNSKLPLSAAQGKELMDLYTVLNSNLGKINLKQFINVSGDYENTVNRGGQVIVCGNLTIISMYFSVKNACVAGATIPFLASGGDTRMIPYGVCYMQACITGGKAFYSEYSSSAFRIISSGATAAGTSFIVSGAFVNTVK